MAIEQIASFTWPTIPEGLAVLNISIDALASRLQLDISAYEEDGLGPARTFAFRTSNDRVFVVTSYEHAIRYANAPGPSVTVDASVLGAFGPITLMKELVAETGLARSEIAWEAGIEQQMAAAEFAARCRQPRVTALHDGEISFDLVMDDDMSFVEGTYRLRHGEWRVFIFSRYEGKRVSSENRQWNSGVGGWHIKTPQERKLNRESVMKILGDLLYVEQWLVVRGPDSMKLR